MAQDAAHTEHRNHSEPQQHQRSEYVADARCPAALDGKKAEQDSNCRRHDVGLEPLGRDVDALECAQYRDCRCDDAIAINQGRSEQAHDDECAAAIEPGRAGQRHQRQDPAFTMVVRAHHEEAVLDGDRDHERPQDQREDADGGLRGKLSTDGLDHRLQGVERTRPEVAIDDAERGECRYGCRSPSDAGVHGALFSGSDDRHRIRPPQVPAGVSWEADLRQRSAPWGDKTEIARSQHAHCVGGPGPSYPGHQGSNSSRNIDFRSTRISDPAFSAC
jgi:hypothetical protein